VTSHGYGVVEAGDDFTAGATMKIYFTPQPDITAYELAVFVAHLGGGFQPRQASISLKMSGTGWVPRCSVTGR
jgi:hypothetical protein